ALWQFLTTGIGGGPIAVALGAIAGGYALGGGRRLWARIVCGVVAVATVIAVAMSVAGIGGARLALTSPRGAWVTILVTSLVAVFMFATAIPFRKLAAGTSRDTRVSE
ncbi:hypothetical protein ACC691_36380, partial [Rhizobium johnstonii]|uniref:hypothetical protein n=1 Tax=Rhizobium johnstonii TaxID=3019933 RepID=UPI003F9CAA45